MSKLLEYYEYLHANPELSKQEVHTSEVLMDTLQNMGYAPVRAGKYGVYADLIADPALLPNVLTQIESTRIAEDFSRYQEVAPGVLMWLGVGDTPSLHNGKFLVPKEVLPLGVDTWLRLAEHKW